MSEVRHLPRFLSLLILGSLLLTCKSYQRAPVNPIANPCAGGKGVINRGRPVICIDDRAAALTVHPDPVSIWDVDRAGNPVNVEWFTVSGADPTITWRTSGCMAASSCRSGGKCEAKTSKRAAGKRCKYDVFVRGHEKLDPEVIITRCCNDEQTP